MIEAIGPGEAPSVSRSFLSELKLIDADFRPFFDKKARRWLIVRLLPVAEEVPVSIHKQGYIIEYCVSKGKEYTPLDRRTLNSLSAITYMKKKIRELDDHLEDLKDSDDVMALEALKQYRLQKREFMKKLYNFEHTETFT